jgi:hypothetical protein
MPVDQISLREYLHAQHGDVVRRLDEISGKLDSLNVRVMRAEVNIAVLQWAYTLGVAVVGWVIYKAL